MRQINRILSAVLRRSYNAFNIFVQLHSLNLIFQRPQPLLMLTCRVICTLCLQQNISRTTFGTGYISTCSLRIPTGAFLFQHKPYFQLARQYLIWLTAFATSDPRLCSKLILACDIRPGQSGALPCFKAAEDARTEAEEMCVHAY